MDGLIDRRLEQAVNRRAPADEVMALVDRYRNRHRGWNVKHFHSWYRRSGGARSYTWVKERLQEANLVPKAEKRGAHRKRRERSPIPGMMIHQDGGTHEWIVGQEWGLIVTMDDATSEHYSMFFVEEEGTSSSFRGVQEALPPMACSARAHTLSVATRRAGWSSKPSAAPMSGATTLAAVRVSTAAPSP